jgi:hypothetical protein
MRSRSWKLLLVLLATVALVAAACGDDDSGDSGDGDTSEASIVRVPQDHDTIQEAVDAAEEGDLVLVDEGTYNEAVNVTTPNITIRGVDRNKVILDGEFELENGIRVLDTDHVAVENMTARNYTTNGFFWTGSDFYKGSYLTAYRNGDYGIYSFDAYHGQFDNSLGWGSPDAGFYVGECFPCDMFIDNVDAQYNGLGYSGTNSGGELYILNSDFANNRAGVVPNSGAYELCYPSRGTTIIGNRVWNNNMTDGPGIAVSLLAQSNGILTAGAVQTTVERNLIWDHDRTGIASVPYPEEDPRDAPPDKSEWETPCEETRDNEPPEDLPSIVMWHPWENSFIDNVVETSGVTDIILSTADPALLGGESDGITLEALENCFSGNQFASSEPADIEALAPCEGEPTSDAWTDTAGVLLELMGEPSPEPPADAYQKTPEPPEQENMPGDVEEIPDPYEGPELPDIDSIEVPSKPDES